MLCVCGCSSGNYCLLRGWISTCPGLCVLYGSPTRLQTDIHNVIKYLTIRLSGDNTTTQVCAHCAFVLNNIQHFVDIDACKQLFVLNSLKKKS